MYEQLQVKKSISRKTVNQRDIVGLQKSLDSRLVTQYMKDENAQIQMKSKEYFMNSQKGLGNGRKSNDTGIPTKMKEKFEGISGYSFDDVKVHYNSDKPAQLQAFAYTKGNHVYIASGQEKHLGHELGHVVQQKQGRVKPTMQLKGLPVNNCANLEKEADDLKNLGFLHQDNSSKVIQRILISDFVFENDYDTAGKINSFKNNDMSIDIWIFTAWEYARQYNLQNTSVNMEDFFKKLFTIEDLLTDSDKIKGTKKETEKIFLSTHGGKGSEPSKIKIGKNEEDTEEVLNKFDETMYQDVYPFYCYMGESEKTRKILASHNSGTKASEGKYVDVAVCNLLFKNEENQAMYLDVIKDTSSNVKEFISLDGCYKTVSEVAENVTELEEFINCKEIKDQETLFKNALLAILNKYAKTFMEFSDAIAKKLGENVCEAFTTSELLGSSDREIEYK